MIDADALRAKARDYELSVAAALERGDTQAAFAFSLIELMLRELAEVAEQEWAA